MTQKFDDGAGLGNGRASRVVREATGRRWWAVGRRMIARRRAWTAEKIIRETHDAGDSTRTSCSGA